VQKCRHCEEKIEAGELAVLAPRLGTGIVLWHPACFICSSCKELLVDLCYCLKDGDIYCERHYADLIVPRCGGCDEVRCLSYLISIALFVINCYDGKSWHGRNNHICRVCHDIPTFSATYVAMHDDIPTFCQQLSV
jgi:hypothetical protein